jgi:sigma-B regulation protein RsbU (phosphoserine phosphatase)
MRPASEVSGDFYDFIELQDEKLAVLVGDVVGKGIPAAILMAAARSTIRSQFENRFPLSQVMERVNRALFRDTAPGTFLTIFCGLFDPEEKTFTYTNCGHNPALYVPTDGGAIRELDVGGTVVGAFHDLAYKEASIQLHEGDLLILYTDGITEALGPSGDTFGRDRLMKWADSQGNNSRDEVIPSLLETLQAFTHQLPRRDDQTVVVLKLK